MYENVNKKNGYREFDHSGTGFTVLVIHSSSFFFTAVQVEEHIRFMSQLVPEWISVLTVRKCVYIKINKTADVNNVINKLMTKEFH